MADYTVTTGPGEEIVLGFMVARINAWGAAQVPPLPAVTKDQLVSVLFHNRLASRFAEIKGEDANRIHDGVEEATEGQKAQIRAILGLP